MFEFLKRMAGRKGWLWLPGLLLLTIAGKILIWPLRLVGNRVALDGNVVFFTQWSKFVLLWPVIPTGFYIAHGLQIGTVSPGVSGWLFVLMALGYLVMLAEEVDFMVGIVLVLLSALFFLGADFIHTRLGVEILKPLIEAITSQRPEVSAGVWNLAAWISTLLIVLYVIPRAVLSGRIEVSGRSIEEYKVFRRAGNFPTVGKSVFVVIRDILEFLLTFGGGHVVVRDPQTERIVKDYGLIFGAWFYNRVITAMYLTTGVHRDDLSTRDPVANDSAKHDPLG